MKPVWLSLTDEDGVLITRVNVAEYDLSRALARAAVVEIIKNAVDAENADAAGVPAGIPDEPTEPCPGYVDSSEWSDCCARCGENRANHESDEPGEVPSGDKALLVGALETCVAEIVTLIPRLSQPYAGNLSAAKDKAKAALRAVGKR